MEGAPCLVTTKDWWTYEFCYGHVIKQYHLEGKNVIFSLIWKMKMKKWKMFIFKHTGVFT